MAIKEKVMKVRRRVESVWIVLAGVLLVTCVCAYAAENNEGEEINTGQDFTRPLTRLDVRYQSQKLSGDTHAHVLLLRMDVPVPLDGGKSGLFYYRMDLPLQYGDTPGRDNPNGDYEFGTGDLFTQFLYVPPPSEDLPWDAWGFGVGFLWPTASQDSFGTEKYQVFPIVGAKWEKNDWSPGSFLTLVGRYYMDFADYSGGDKRDDIATLEIQPIVHYMVPKDWEMPFDFVDLWPLEGIKFNFEDGATKESGDVFVPFDIMFGKMLNKSTVFSLEFATPIYKDSGYDLYDWKIGVRMGFFF
jgi:hypothetical protein